MTTFTKEFVNEYGEEVTISVTYQRGSVTVTFTTSSGRLADEVMTPRERMVLRELMNPLNTEPKYKSYV